MNLIRYPEDIITELDNLSIKLVNSSQRVPSYAGNNLIFSPKSKGGRGLLSLKDVQTQNFLSSILDNGLNSSDALAKHSTNIKYQESINFLNINEEHKTRITQALELMDDLNIKVIKNERDNSRIEISNFLGPKEKDLLTLLHNSNIHNILCFFDENFKALRLEEFLTKHLLEPTCPMSKWKFTQNYNYIINNYSNIVEKFAFNGQIKEELKQYILQESPQVESIDTTNLTWDKDSNSIIVATDGSLAKEGNAGIGICFGQFSKYNLSKRVEGEQTCLNAELQAILTVLQMVPSYVNTTIITDSLTSKTLVEHTRDWIESKWRKLQAPTATLKRIMKLICHRNNANATTSIIHVHSHILEKIHGGYSTQKLQSAREKYDRMYKKHGEKLDTYLQFNYLSDLLAKEGSTKQQVIFPHPQKEHKDFLIVDTQTTQMYDTGIKKYIKEILNRKRELKLERSNKYSLWLLNTEVDIERTTLLLREQNPNIAHLQDFFFKIHSNQLKTKEKMHKRVQRDSSSFYNNKIRLVYSTNTCPWGCEQVEDQQHCISFCENARKNHIGIHHSILEEWFSIAPKHDILLPTWFSENIPCSSNVSSLPTDIQKEALALIQRIQSFDRSLGDKGLIPKALIKLIKLAHPQLTMNQLNQLILQFQSKILQAGYKSYKESTRKAHMHIPSTVLQLPFLFVSVPSISITRGKRMSMQNSCLPRIMPNISDSDIFSQVIDTPNDASLQRAIKRLRVSTISEFISNTQTPQTILIKSQYLERKGVSSSFIHNSTYKKITTLLSQDSHTLRPRIGDYLRKSTLQTSQQPQTLQPLHRFIAFQSYPLKDKKRKKAE
jgi:ribonuclease HI